MRDEHFVIETYCTNEMWHGMSKKHHNGQFMRSRWWWFPLALLMDTWKISSCFWKKNLASDVFLFACPAKFVWFCHKIMIIMLWLNMWLLKISVSILKFSQYEHKHLSIFNLFHFSLCVIQKCSMHVWS